VRVWILAILGGLALAPIGGVVGLGVAYVFLAWRGVTEQQGRRGMQAFLFGLIVGAPLGFWIGFEIAWWLCTRGGGSWGATWLGGLLSILGALAVGVPGLVRGVHLAERRGVSNDERTAWAMRHVALPAAVIGGVAAFMLGWWLCPRS
jgi:hypothetical protein